jgi:hypothetical protein
MPSEITINQKLGWRWRSLDQANWKAAMVNKTERRNGFRSRAPEAGEVDEARRIALRTMSRYASYTAPAILALLAAGDAAAQEGPRLSIACPAGNPDKPVQC